MITELRLMQGRGEGFIIDVARPNNTVEVICGRLERRNHCDLLQCPGLDGPACYKF